MALHKLTNVDVEARTGDCAACGSAVRVRHKLNGAGARSWVCRTATARRAAGADQRRKPAQQQRRRLRTYGLPEEEFARLREVHGDACAICGAETRLAIDHCHRGGDVRGLLCSPCNLGLGNFRDDPERLAAAIVYLMR